MWAMRCNYASRRGTHGGGPGSTGLGQDLRYGARMLRRSPGFTAAAVLMLALGVGVNVAAFGFFDLMFLRPLPVRDPATLLRFDRAGADGYSDNFSYAEVSFYKEHAKTLSAVMAVSFGRLAMEGSAQQIDVHFVTGNFFQELGGRASAGRLMDPARDEAAGAEAVVVLSAGLWQRQFGGDAGIVGRSIRLNQKPVTVVGVASKEFSGLGSGTPALWALIEQAPYFMKGSRLHDFADGGVSAFMWGRLQAGVTPRAAEAELQSLAAELHSQHPKDIWEKESLPSQPGGYANRIRHEMIPALLLAGALGLLILAAACANLGSLLLARGVARRREMAIRASVGAGRTRLIRQLFTESLLLAGLGTAAGLLVGYVVVRALAAWAELPVWLNPAPDWRLIAFATGMGFAAAILFGLTPAWETARQRHGRRFARQFTIGAQVAASCVLLIVAALLVRALNRAMFAGWGFDSQQVMTIDPQFHGASEEEARSWIETARTRIGGLPGVAAVSMASNPPLGNRWTVAKADIGGKRGKRSFQPCGRGFFPDDADRAAARADTEAGGYAGSGDWRIAGAAAVAVGRSYRQDAAGGQRRLSGGRGSGQCAAGIAGGFGLSRGLSGGGRRDSTFDGDAGADQRCAGGSGGRGDGYSEGD